MAEQGKVSRRRSRLLQGWRRRVGPPRRLPRQPRRPSAGNALRRAVRWLPVALVALALAGGVTWWQWYGPVPVDPQVEQAIVAGDWQKVAELAEAWQQRAPESLVAKAVLGEALVRLGHVQRASQAERGLRHAFAQQSPGLWLCVRWARTLARNHRGCAAAWDLLARALTRVHDEAGALRAANEAIRLAPGESGPYQLRAMVYDQRREYDLALADADGAVKMAPRDAEAHLVRATAHYHRHNYDGAIADCTSALELGPGNAGALALRGDARRGKGDLRGALADYGAAITLDPQDADIYVRRGIANDSAGDYGKGIADYTKAIALDPQNEAAYFNRAVAYGHRQENTAAERDYEQVIGIRPRSARSYYARGCAHRAMKGLGAAIGDFSSAIRLDPRYADAYLDRGWAYLHLQDSVNVPPQTDAFTGERRFGYTYWRTHYRDAIVDFTEAIALTPADAVPYYGRATAYVRVHDYTHAIADASQAIALNPKYANAYLQRGIALRRSGAPAEALADDEKTIALKPAPAFAWYEKGLALEALGRTKDASQALLQAMHAAPQSRDPEVAGYAREELRKLGVLP
jgi:tetratricopeptide (TPR) repeat protein